MARVLKSTEARIPCRISFAHVIDTDKNGVYSVQLLIPKKDTKTITEINTAINNAISEGKSKLANKDGSINRKMLKLPLRDADEEGKTGDYANMMFLNAKSKRRPQVVDRHKEGIFSTDEIYSGCFCNVVVNFYAFAMEGNKGIAVGLGNIQKTHDGEKLGFGGTSAEDDFDVLDSDDDNFSL